MKQSKIIFKTFLIIMILASCRDKVFKSVTKRSNEPDVYNVFDDSEKMNEAMEKARRTMSQFNEAFASNNSDFEFFSLKQAFTHSSGDEHIWVNNLFLKDDNYWGTVSNQPINDVGYGIEDTVKIEYERISDWLYYDKNIVRGAFTIRVIRNALNKKEKEEFDLQNGLMFDD